MTADIEARVGNDRRLIDFSLTSVQFDATLNISADVTSGAAASTRHMRALGSLTGITANSAVDLSGFTFDGDDDEIIAAGAVQSARVIVGAVFMSAAAIQVQRGHVAIEAIVGLLSPGVNRVRMLLVDIASLAS